VTKLWATPINLVIFWCPFSYGKYHEKAFFVKTKIKMGQFIIHVGGGGIFGGKKTFLSSV